VTICELIVISLVVGIVSGVVSAYMVRFLNKRKHKITAMRSKAITFVLMIHF